MTTEQTCEQRIAGQWSGRREDFERMQKAIETRDNEDDYTEIQEYPLALSKRVEIRLDLSTGGPADFLTYSVDPEDGSVERITYHFQDWFDGASLALTGDDFEAAENYLNQLIDVQSYVTE